MSSDTVEPKRAPVYTDGLTGDQIDILNQRLHGFENNRGSQVVQTDSLRILEAAPVAERLRALFFKHSIISPLCLMWVRAPFWPHVRQAKF